MTKGKVHVLPESGKTLTFLSLFSHYLDMILLLFRHSLGNDYIHIQNVHYKSSRQKRQKEFQYLEMEHPLFSQFF